MIALQHDRSPHFFQLPDDNLVKVRGESGNAVRLQCPPLSHTSKVWRLKRRVCFALGIKCTVLNENECEKRVFGPGVCDFFFYSIRYARKSRRPYRVGAAVWRILTDIQRLRLGQRQYARETSALCCGYLWEVTSLPTCHQRAGGVRVKAENLVCVVHEKILNFLGHVLPGVASTGRKSEGARI